MEKVFPEGPSRLNQGRRNCAQTWPLMEVQCLLAPWASVPTASAAIEAVTTPLSTEADQLTHFTVEETKVAK